MLPSKEVRDRVEVHSLIILLSIAVAAGHIILSVMQDITEYYDTCAAISQPHLAALLHVSILKVVKCH